MTSAQNPTLSSFKALLFDVDKTLTNSKREVSPRTAMALQAMAEKDKALAVCSGRHTAMLIKDIFPYFPANSIHIVAGGSLLVNSLGKTMWERTIPGQIAQEIMHRAHDLEMGINCPREENLYLNHFFRDRYSHFPQFARSEPLEIEQVTQAHVLVLTEVTSEILRFLDSIPEISYKFMSTALGSPYVDITARGVNKATGIMEWCKLIHVDPAEIIGFGDAENDEEFLQFVGHSVAMGNATDELKRKVHQVIGHTDQDGLAVYLEQLMKGASL